MAGLLDLTRVEVRVSGVLAASLDLVWPVIRQFGSLPFIRNIGQEVVNVYLLPGCLENQVGAVRCVNLGNHNLVERLTALDDTRHTLSYKLISHPLNSNPFIGSFVNYAATYRLLSVTLGNHALCEMEGTFYTEHAQVREMHSKLEGLYFHYIQALNSFMVASLLRPIGAALQTEQDLHVNAAPMRPIGTTTNPTGRQESAVSTSQSMGGPAHVAEQQAFLQQQSEAMPAKMSSLPGSRKHSVPDPGGSPQGQTFSALHAQQASQSAFHPNPHLTQMSPAPVSLEQYEAALQQQQLYLQQQEQQALASQSMAASLARLNLHQPPDDSPQHYARAAAPHTQPMSTPFASASGLSNSGGELLADSQPSGRRTSSESAGRAQRGVIELLTSGGGGKTHMFGGIARAGGPPIAPHTAIRDLQSSGASTVGPGTLVPLGSADSLGMSPSNQNRVHSGADQIDSGSTPTSAWASHQTDGGQHSALP